MARLEVVVAQPQTPSVVFQRVAEGESLKEIAKSWQVPVGRFTEWFTTEHAGLYDAALKVRADQLAHEALDTADGADAETVGPSKLQVQTRQWLASRWDRARYGEQVQHQLSGRAVLKVDFSRPGERVIEPEPPTIPALEEI